MATEFRRITFNHDELRRAIENHKSNGNVPEGEISIIRSKRKNGQNGYEIEAFDPKKSKVQQIFIAEDNALEMLIESCLLARIALPRVARKLVREIDSHLCLDLITE